MRRTVVVVAVGLLVLAAGLGIGLSSRAADLRLQQTGQVVAHVPCGIGYLPSSPHGPLVAADGKQINGDLTVACDRQNPLAWTVLAWVATLVGGAMVGVAATRLRRGKATA